MIEVYISFDAAYGTWNIMREKECIYHTEDVLDIDIWLESRRTTHVERSHY